MYYGGYYGGFDLTQILLIAIPFVFCLITQGLVKARYNRYSKIGNRRNITGAQAAYELLRSQGITNVRIEQVAGNLTDHYDPKTNAIRLSEGVYNSTSIAAVGIACHEAGHACQYQTNYFPMKIRAVVIPAANIGSSIGLPLCILGIIFTSFSFLFYIGLILYGAVFVFQLATLPVEFNASSRALQSIKQIGLLGEDEYPGAKKVLSAAALTYVAAMASSLLTIIRLLLIGGRRR